jgi:AcrR family transcriptional regulator
MSRRDEIYDKAMELFIVEGYDQTPLSRIAEALGLTKAGLYHYIKSKEELLFHIHEHHLRKNLLPILDAAEKIADPEKRIAYFIKEHTENGVTKDASLRVLIHEVNRLKPEHREIIRKTWRRVFDLIRNGLSEMEALGRIRKMNKSFSAFAAIGMFSWTFYWFDYERRDSAGELADTFLDIFFNGVSKME